MKNKKVLKWLIIFCVLVLIGIILFLLFFKNDTSKKLKIGNNSTSQEIVDYILNIGSYNTEIEVEVKSNKNTNKYILKQECISPDINSQEVIEPSNIAGVKLIRNGNNLMIENTNLNLSTVFEKYEYISENDLDLSCFINDYKNSEDTHTEEKNGEVIMDVSINGKSKKLYIDKSNAVPTKMNIIDNIKNITVYIVYNKVNVNS